MRLRLWSRVSDVEQEGRGRTQAHIRRLGAAASSDLEALALLFDDDGIADDGTIMGRLRAVLRATERRTIPGLYTAVPFGDSGFAGDRRRGGEGFRDPWPASRNQVGHFLTAVALRVAPEVVSRPIPVLGSIRAIVGAPRTMGDAEVALRLAIGHEKLADPPNAVEAGLLVLARGLIAARRAVAGDNTIWIVARRIARTLLVEALLQAAGTLMTYRAQFTSVTDDDLGRPGAGPHTSVQAPARSRATCWRGIHRRCAPSPSAAARATACRTCA